MKRVLILLFIGLVVGCDRGPDSDREPADHFGQDEGGVQTPEP